MRRRKAIKYLKQKSFIIVLMVCFVSAVALIGLYRYGNDNEEENLVDLNEMETVSEEENEKTEVSTESVTADNYDEDKVNFGQDNVMDATDEYISTEEAGTPAAEGAEETAALTEAPAETETEETKDSSEAEENETLETKAAPITYNFKESDKLLWPVEGNVLLNYNMENTIYFATLNQYKCNPAVIIQSDVGTPVKAVANGKVESIQSFAETGNTLVMDLGNGFKATYGQLKDIQFKAGDIVASGQTLAYVSETSKYYSVEGNNLYFKLTKDESPINPMNFFD